MEGEITQSVTDNAAPVAPQIVNQTEVSRETSETSDSNQNLTDGNGKPEGFAPVEFTPEQKKRVDRLYGNMKRYETDARELRDINQRLIDTVQQLEKNQSEIVNHLHNSNYQEAEKAIKSQKREALNKGDMETYDTLNEKLIEISVARKAAEKLASAQPKQQDFVYGKSVSGGDVIERAVQQGSVTSEEADIYRSWMNETDEFGNAKRPWATSGDVRNSAAAFEGRAVFSNPAYADKPFADKLREIDRRMGIVNQQQQKNQSVLPAGNLTRPNSNSKVAVSDYEARVAIRTKFGGPKAKSDADHVEAWKQAKIKSQSKGGRK